VSAAVEVDGVTKRFAGTLALDDGFPSRRLSVV